MRTSSALSLVARLRFVYMNTLRLDVMELHEVCKELRQGLINVQCRKSLEVVTATAGVLDELGLMEVATQLRGWLVYLPLVDK